MRSSTWFSSLAVVIVPISFIASTALAEAPPPAPERAAAAVAEPGCAAQAPLEIESLFAAAEAPVCAAAEAVPAQASEQEPEPIFRQGPPQLRRFCHCGCGVPCTTDSDCGAGGRCVSFVTCC